VNAAFAHRPVRPAIVAVVLALGVAAPAEAAGEQPFSITGEVAGLYPGIVTTLDAVVTNHQPFEIRIVSVSVRVDDATAECPGSLLDIADVTPDVAVAAGATERVPLALRMSRSAADACQHATFPLLFTARAVATSDAPNAPPSGPLPITGSAVVPFLAAGLVALSVGSLIRRLARSRST
jgi:hypothetical protein